VPEGTQKVFLEVFFAKLPEGVHSEPVKLEFDVIKPMPESFVTSP
jgi:hypothetical protein